MDPALFFVGSTGCSTRRMWYGPRVIAGEWVWIVRGLVRENRGTEHVAAPHDVDSAESVPAVLMLQQPEDFGIPMPLGPRHSAGNQRYLWAPNLRPSSQLCRAVHHDHECHW